MDRLTDRAIGIPNDFIRRKRHGRFAIYVVAYALAILAILILAFFHEFFGATFILIAIVLIFGGLTLCSLLGMQRLLDLVLSVEFQNAIFSSALTRKFDFTIIIDSEGSITYYDRGFQTYFPDIPSSGGQAVNQLLSKAGILGEKEREITNVIFSGESGHFMIDLPLSEEQTKRFHVSFSPVIRPVGFYVLQGRTQMERGNTDKSMNQNDLMSIMQEALLHSLQSGAYITDHQGQLLYLNPALAQLLGYGEQELMQRGLHMSELLYTADGSRFDMEQGDFYGEVLLRHHNGSLVRSIVQQRSMYLPAGDMLGVFGMVKRKE